MAGRSETMPVNPKVILWARTSSGCTAAEVGKSAGVNEQRVLDWESGATQPTIPQLRAVAARVRRPLAVLLLEEPPEDPPAVHDFRRLPGHPAGRVDDSRALRFELRRLRHEQAELAEILGRPGRWSIDLPALSVQDDPSDAAARLRSALGVSRDEQADAGEHGGFRLWRTRVEDTGVFVQTLAGIEVAEMRGVVLPHAVAPFIAVNNADALVARLFTLAHELAHLALREDGLCSEDEDVPNEAWCNAVAGSMLVPAIELLAHPLVSTATEWTDEDLRKIARGFGVSRQVVLRRLMDLGKVPAPVYAATVSRWTSEAHAHPPVEREPKEGGPTFYRTKVAHLGRAFVTAVLDAVHDQRVTTSRACDLLGVKVRNLQRLEDEVWS